jgi:single-stranded-DNA-specific exonuclease
LLYQEEYTIDAVLPCAEINLDLQKELAQMAPFGVGNPEPLLLTSNLTIKKLITIGKEGEHLKLFLESGDHQLEAVAFRKGQALEELNNMKIIDMIYTLEANDYLGQERVQAVLKDYRQANGDSFTEAACSSEEPEIKPLRGFITNKNNHISLTKQNLVNIYKELKKQLKLLSFPGSLMVIASTKWNA